MKMNNSGCVLVISLIVVVVWGQDLAIKGPFTANVKDVSLNVNIYFDPENQNYRSNFDNPQYNSTVWLVLGKSLMAQYLSYPGFVSCCETNIFGKIDPTYWIGQNSVVSVPCSGYSNVTFYSGLWNMNLQPPSSNHLYMGFSADATTNPVCVMYSNSGQNFYVPIDITYATPNPSVFEVDFPPSCTCTIN
eukprot:TRINITY_DN11464_c0_g1_i1.p1 TRINITY_DN11464_c0_g1~~TRINITY_DN11464_c0_g1_i1.p1  ORF type:complete len:190 (-),score=30.68 TRINITY_DN11464_c0_g1_i1:5-574(-)